MSITVNDCFCLTSLSGGKLLGGHQGLDEIVTRISVLEYDDGLEHESSQLMTYNELLISSFYSIKDDVQAQCRSLRYFKETGNVGLILLYVGDILKEIDPLLIETANEINMPLYLVSGSTNNIRYSDIITDVMEAIFIDNRRENNIVQTTMNLLSRFPSHQRSIDSLLRIISDQCKLSLFLCDPNDILITNALWPLHSNLNYDYFNKIQSEYGNKSPIIEKTKEYVDTYYYTTTIHCNHEPVKLKIIDQYNHYFPSIVTEIEECLNIFSSVYHYNMYSISTKMLVECLIKGNHYLTNEISKKLSLNINVFNHFYIFFYQEDTKSFHNFILELKDNLTNQFIIEEFDDYCILYCFKQNEVIINQVINEFNLIHCLYYTIHHYQDIKTYYQEFIQSLVYLKKLYQNQKILNNSNIHFIKQLLTIKKDENEYQRLLNLTNILIKDQKNELMKTLYTYYFSAQRSAKITANLLFIHRNTVQYRINTIKELVKYDLNQLPESIELYTSCALHALNGI